MATMEIALTGRWAIDVDGGWGSAAMVLMDQQTGARTLVCPTLRKARKFQAEHKESFRAIKPIAFAVPSVIVPVWNVVLYPSGKGFRKHIGLKDVSPFEFDPRLFPDSALPEDPT